LYSSQQQLSMPLFETTPIDEARVRTLVREGWSLELGKCLKASQNHTYEATKEGTEDKYIVRVTPDHQHERLESIRAEIDLLRYLHSKGLLVCPSVTTSKEPREELVQNDDVVIVVFNYARGAPVLDFVDFRWITDQRQPEGIGRWLAKFHALSKCYAKERPEMVEKFRGWRDLHDGILKDVPLDPADVASSNDPNSFGIIHGDVNISNFLWDTSSQLPIMFDWDQSQRAWYLYDLSSPIWTVITMAKGGNPIDKTPVPQADVQTYTEHLLRGYETESGEKVDRSALQRMIAIRRQLYKRFCKKAVDELPEDHSMAKFCAYMNTWLDKE